ncbi:ABC transporter substrate-binding protein [Sediminibacter sp. Hel_I_10]|uniref:ABC transporter substrate-binding protein n=1 Tax=Sediminibacter sp. Hel_I_10 TaxID=1392490 RepID=UPI00047D22CF|nr:helical backbone metal receptor [Sediminibacter sp. Hel_I_10]
MKFTVKDQLQRSVILKERPQRIVSLVPSQTELIVDLGLEVALLGVTKFCVHPTHLLKDKTIVGGTKQVHFDRIKALNPDVILCNKEENTEAMVSELETIAPVHISDVGNLEDALALITMYGELFKVEDKAKVLVTKIKAKQHELDAYLNGVPSRSAAYFIWKKPWMVAASQTFIDAMLRCNHFENVFSHSTRYPEITLADLKKRHPEIILLSSEPYPFQPKHVQSLQAQFPNSKVLIVDGEAFSWYGSRLLKAFDYFKMLHQDHLS